MFSFFAMIFRQKYMRRWSMMRSIHDETLSEHSMECAVIAHALAVIGNTYFGKDYDADRACTLALYHDAAEVYSGDLPTPVKYFDDEMRTTYARVEEYAVDKLLHKLPKEMSLTYSEILRPEDEELEELVKIADKLCAFIKCLEEQKSGNTEFRAAAGGTYQRLMEYRCPELEFFMNHCLPAFEKNLDEL